MTARQVKVLFLAGKGRSGGTLLASLLGQLPGFFNIGELNRLWDWGLVSNFKCGCGLPVQECPTWHAILDAADGLLVGPTGSHRSRPRASISRRRAVVRWPRMLQLLRARPGQHRLAGARPLHRRVVGRVPEHRAPHRRARRGRLVAASDRAGRARPRSRRRRARRAGHPRSARGRVLVEAFEADDRSRQRRVHAEVQRVVLDHELARAQPRGRGDPAPRPGGGRAVRRDGA